MPDRALSVRVVSPERSVYEGAARSVVAPAWDGKVGILPGHAPMVALLGVGELAIDAPEGGSEAFFVAGGVLRVESDGVIVLSEFASREPPDAAEVAELTERFRLSAAEEAPGDADA